MPPPFLLGVAEARTPAPIPELRGVAPGPIPPILGVRDTACIRMASALARSILYRGYQTTLTREVGGYALVTLSGHLRLKFGPLAKIAIRARARQTIEILLTDRKEDSSELG